MANRILVITGTDTGVGKTVLTALLARYLRSHGLAVAALKPISSGGRGDARALYAALDGAFSLDEINPWHFHAPLAPLLAARRENKRVSVQAVLEHVRRTAERCDSVLVEGAGGLLSPLGEGFNTRDLIVGLRARPVVVCPNRVGAVNQVRLLLEALPRAARGQAQVVLVTQARPALSEAGNPQLLAEFIGGGRVQELPWVRWRQQPEQSLRDTRVRKALSALAGAWSRQPRKTWGP
jgi:dethiobiotin synthetase